jgi:hypothetical protein
MDLHRFLDKCREGQWKISDLDWSVAPRPMTAAEERAIVQYFTNMAGIERLAGALFEIQRGLTDDPTLQKIFSTFVADEERHAQAAERLAEFYDRHHYQTYALAPELLAFRTPFLDAIKCISPEVANNYVTSGELLLDVALLRSLNDYVGDAMSNQVMELINRDESRHIAMDYYMMDFYASTPQRAPQKSLRESLHAAFTMAKMIYYARPFLVSVFLNPMELLDKEGARLKEAFKRMQYLALKPHLQARPFAKFLYTTRRAYNMPVVGPIFGSLISRIGGAPGKYMADLYTAQEAEQIRRMSVEEMAQEALSAKMRN